MSASTSGSSLPLASVPAKNMSDTKWRGWVEQFLPHMMSSLARDGSSPRSRFKASASPFSMAVFRFMSSSFLLGGFANCQTNQRTRGQPLSLFGIRISAAGDPKVSGASGVGLHVDAINTDRRRTEKGQSHRRALVGDPDLANFRLEAFLLEHTLHALYC